MAKGPMKTAKRVVFWGPLAALAVIYFFGQQIGLFPGGQEAALRNQEQSEPAEIDETTIKVMAPESDVKFESTSKTDRLDSDETGEPAAPRLLHIMIDDRDLFVATGSSRDDDATDWQPIGLSEIVSRAETIEANDAGLRVLVSRRGSSRVSTEMELIEALHQAGLTDDEIHVEEKLMP